MTTSPTRQKEHAMTATTTTATTTTKTDNPHRPGTLILGLAIPFVFFAAVWGAVHHPEHAGISAGAFLLIVVLYGIKRVQYLAWNRWGSGK